MKSEMLHHKILRRTRRLIPPRGFRAVQQHLRGRRGIEVGGPSAVFQRWNLWPLYPVLAALDHYNFASRTIWSNQERGASVLGLVAGRTPPGRQLIGEASLMGGIEPSSYDGL